jgi:hypothetical protein
MYFTVGLLGHRAPALFAGVTHTSHGPAANRHYLAFLARQRS